MQNPSRSYYPHLEFSFPSMEADRVHENIASVVAYGMYTVTRLRTVKANAVCILILNCRLLATLTNEICAEDLPRKTYAVENLCGYTSAGILV